MISTVTSPTGMRHAVKRESGSMVHSVCGIAIHNPRERGETETVKGVGCSTCKASIKKADNPKSNSGRLM